MQTHQVYRLDILKTALQRVIHLVEYLLEYLLDAQEQQHALAALREELFQARLEIVYAQLDLVLVTQLQLQEHF